MPALLPPPAPEARARGGDGGDDDQAGDLRLYLLFILMAALAVACLLVQ
jgi:hypothetical protein